LLICILLKVAISKRALPDANSLVQLGDQYRSIRNWDGSNFAAEGEFHFEYESHTTILIPQFVPSIAYKLALVVDPKCYR